MGNDDRIMKILVADDDPVSRHRLTASLEKWGYLPINARNGAEAWQMLQAENRPRLAILDWMMPKMSGPEVCAQARSLPETFPTYFILLTARTARQDLVRGLEAGADDYVIKPFDSDELHARVRVGIRVVQLQQHLEDHIQELVKALTCVKQLQGLLPICSYCKRIRNDRNYWQQVESYISEHSEAEFSHGICPDCFEKHVKSQLAKESKVEEQAQ